METKEIVKRRPGRPKTNTGKTYRSKRSKSDNFRIQIYYYEQLLKIKDYYVCKGYNLTINKLMCIIFDMGLDMTPSELLGDYKYYKNQYVRGEADIKKLSLVIPNETYDCLTMLHNQFGHGEPKARLLRHITITVSDIIIESGIPDYYLEEVERLC